MNREQRRSWRRDIKRRKTMNPSIKDVPCQSCTIGYVVAHRCDAPEYCPCDQPDLHWVQDVNDVLDAVRIERINQRARYGDNADTPDGNGPETRWLQGLSNVSARKAEALFRADYEAFEEETGGVTWVHLLREEMAEVAKESDGRKLEVELIQLAALCVSQVQQLRKRGHELLPVEHDGSAWCACRPCLLEQRARDREVHEAAVSGAPVD